MNKLCLNIFIIFIIACPLTLVKANARHMYRDSTKHLDNDTIWEFSYKQGICKMSFFDLSYRIVHRTSNQVQQIPKKGVEIIQKSIENNMRGYLTYEYYYNERMDTPITNKAFEQHMLSGSIRVNFSNKYPFVFNFSTRQTNNYFVRNFFDLGLKFDYREFLNKKRKIVFDNLASTLPFKKRIDSLSNLVERKENRMNNLVNDLDNINIKQLIVEERELYIKSRLSIDLPSINLNQQDSTLKSLPITDSITAEGVSKFDLSKDTFPEMPSEALYKKKRLEADSLQRIISAMNLSIDSLKKVDAKAQLEISQAYGNISKLKEVQVKYGIPNDKHNINKADEKLLAVKSFGIGRTDVNYSDLTIMNQSILGLQVEYEPKLYFAVAGGKVDYNYRDLLFTNTSRPSQDFFIARVGTPREAKQGIILSVFAGKKNSTYQSNISNKFSGFSIQYFKKINTTTEAFFEIAKTTSPSINNVPQKNSSLFNLSDYSNLAYSGKVSTFITSTNTRLQATVRKVGYNFQSINFFSNYSNQLQWNIKVDQSFFRRNLIISASIKQNDYSNPLLQESFSAKTVLKTITATFKKRKLPFISVGYYPGYYTVVQDNKAISQSIYYIVNSSVGYTFIRKQNVFTTFVNYNKFFNEANDSSAINFSGTSFQISQALSFKKLSLHCSWTNNDQSFINYNSYEAGFDLIGLKKINLGAGIKCNTVQDHQSYWGNNFLIGIDFGRFGKINFNYDKQFMPQKNGALIGADVSRLILTKYL